MRHRLPSPASDRPAKGLLRNASAWLGAASSRDATTPAGGFDGVRLECVTARCESGFVSSTIPNEIATATTTTSAQPRVVVRRSAQRRKTVSARREGDSIVVMVPAHLNPRDEAVWVDRMVARLRARESTRIAPHVQGELHDRAVSVATTWLDPIVGRPVRPTDVAWVSNQLRRWGSCSPDSGRIRLSHRLRTMPDWVVDYVLMHELVHLVEQNHTARFHSLVAGYPHTDRAKAFLEGWSHAQGESGASDPPEA